MNMKNKKKTSFSAVVKLPAYCNEDETTVDVEFDKDENHLTYDEVENAIIDAAYDYCSVIIDSDDADDEDYPEVISIVINANDGESYPVISESMDDSKLKNSKIFSKYLVLPDAVYELTPECKLWIKLKENGIIGEDEPFDYEKYHKLMS